MSQAVQELDKRVMEDRLSVSDSADVDYLIQCASNLKRAARAERAGDVEVVQEQMIKAGPVFAKRRHQKSKTPAKNMQKQSRLLCCCS